MSRAGEAVRARLRALARDRGTTTELLLSRWLAEAFLRRLSGSPCAGILALKGGHLFTAWEGDLLRATADLDLEAGDAGREEVRAALLAAAAEPGDDGVEFDAASAEARGLPDGRRGGLRLLLPAAVGTARMRLKVDVGFGHPIRPGPEVRQHPSLLPGFPSFPVRACPRETMVAEKLAVAVEFGRDNTRLRDYHDLWHLSERYRFLGHVLADAIACTFGERDAGRLVLRRDGYWEGAFDPAFADARSERAWRGWIAEHAPASAPPCLGETVAKVARFAMPPLDAVRDGRAFVARWSPEAGWSSPRSGTSSHGAHAARSGTHWTAPASGG